MAKLTDDRLGTLRGNYRAGELRTTGTGSRVTSANFDDPNLIASAGLVPVSRLAEAARLTALAQQHLSVPTDKGANAAGRSHHW